MAYLPGSTLGRPDKCSELKHCAYALSSLTEAFNEECAKLRSIFSRLDYPINIGLIKFHHF